MHILEIPSFFPPYGGLFCLDQAKALAALGHEVRILSNVQLGASVGLKDYLTLPYGRYEHLMDGIMVYQSYQRGVPKMIRHNVSRWVTIVQSMFADYEKRYGLPDIIHAHCAKWAGYAAMLISREYGIPYVITEHLPKEILALEFGVPPNEALGQKHESWNSTVWQIAPLRQSYQEAGMVIHVSDEQEEELSCYFESDYHHLTISNIIDVDYFAYRERQSLHGRPFRFCCLALMVERKGYDVLFAAFSRLLQLGANVQLHIAGQGTNGQIGRHLMKEAGCEEHVVVHGALSKEGVRKLLYASDALVLASRGESQGLVLLEAMSTGIPAISTEAIPRSVRPECGFRYVPVDDVDALAVEMLKAVEHPRSDGRMLSEWVRRKASPQVVGQQIATVLTQVVREQKK